MKPTTVRVDAATLERLDGFAKASGRSRTWVIKDALQKYLEYETWFAGEVVAGQEDMATGRTLAHNELKTRLRGRGVRVD
jgi:predicted transcriptional regulator